jgi:hypothetical protein
MGRSTANKQHKDLTTELTVEDCPVLCPELGGPLDGGGGAGGPLDGGRGAGGVDLIGH